MIVAAQGQRGARAAFATRSPDIARKGGDEADFEPNSNDEAEKPKSRCPSQPGTCLPPQQSESMPSSDNDARPNPRDKAEEDEPYQWTWRGSPLEIVSEYKYLGLWLSNDLSWSSHLKKLVAKGKEANRNLNRLLSLRAVPTSLKRLVWKAVVRSKLDHGGAIYRTNTKQAKALESIQHQACARMLAVNRRTPIPVARAMAGIKCSLETRRAGQRMKYFHKLSAMGENRWPKHLFSLPKVAKEKLRGPRPAFWPEAVANEVEEANLRVECSRGLNDSCEFLTANSEGILEVNKITKERWHAAVATWAETQGKKEARLGGGTASSSRLYQRLIDGCTSNAMLPATPSLAASSDILRVRLICGTNALHSSIGRYSKYAAGNNSLDELRRLGKCPTCKDGPEDVEHLLLRCKSDAEIIIRKAIDAACTCEGETCFDRFTKLSVDEKLLFLLGQSKIVTGKEVEDSVDQALREYLVSIWRERSKSLETISTSMESISGDSETDPTLVNPEKEGAQMSILSFFSASSAGLEANGQLSMP